MILDLNPRSVATVSDHTVFSFLFYHWLLCNTCDFKVHVTYEEIFLELLPNSPFFPHFLINVINCIELMEGNTNLETTIFFLQLVPPSLPDPIFFPWCKSLNIDLQSLFLVKRAFNLKRKLYICVKCLALLLSVFFVLNIRPKLLGSFTCVKKWH